VIRGWINATALGISKEVVQGIIAALSVVISCVLTKIASVADRIIDRTVRARLLRGVVTLVCIVMRVAVIWTGTGTGVHLSRMIIIASGGSCKILQVSDYIPTSDVGMCGNNL
jgi:hypothetical protein